MWRVPHNLPSSCQIFWRIVKDFFKRKLPWWNTPPFLLSNSELFRRSPVWFKFSSVLLFCLVSSLIFNHLSRLTTPILYDIFLVTLHQRVAGINSLQKIFVWISMAPIHGISFWGQPYVSDFKRFCS